MLESDKGSSLRPSFGVRWPFGCATIALAMAGEVELIGGRERRRIEIVAYDPSWPSRFVVERARIAGALGAIARRIDHVGSTAVEGLAAKPIIDIDVSVDDLGNEGSYLQALELAGYGLRVREPGHRMLRTPTLDVHVHVCRAGSDWDDGIFCSVTGYVPTPPTARDIRIQNGDLPVETGAI